METIRTQATKEFPTMHRILTVLAVSGALLLGGTTGAWADLAGNPGKLVAFRHLDNDSDDYGTHRGMLVVDEGGSLLQEYRWGGTLCAGRDLDVDQQKLLVQALASKMRVVPAYKNGQAGVRCVVAFGLTSKSKFDSTVTP